MSEPAVSAVIPNLNSGFVLDRCLDALERAGCVAEVLVLDAGSDDGSDERARERPGVKVLAFPDTDIADRINRGIEAGSSDLALLLNSDAYVDPETPRLLAEAVLADDRLGASGASLRYEDDSPQKSGGPHKTLLGLTLRAVRIPARSRTVPDGPPPRTGSTEVEWLPLCAAVIRRDAWRAVGGFDDRYGFYFDDVDFSRALTHAGWNLAVRWDATAIHVGGGSTRTKDPARWFVRYHENALIYLRKWYPRAWRFYSAVWFVRATLHSLLWRLRGLGRRLRRDEEGVRHARDWARAFSSTARS